MDAPEHRKLSYTVTEACAVTGLSRVTLYRARTRGDLPMYLRDGRIIILASDLEAYIVGAPRLPPRGASPVRRQPPPRKPRRSG